MAIAKNYTGYHDGVSVYEAVLNKTVLQLWQIPINKDSVLTKRMSTRNWRWPKPILIMMASVLMKLNWTQ
jgi:hypothetical protein